MYFIIINFFPPENCEIMWESMEQPDRPQMTIKYGACASHSCYLRPHTHTHTHTHNVMFIAFPRQQRFRECALLLRHTSGVIACLRCALFMCNSYGQTKGQRAERLPRGTKTHWNIRVHGACKVRMSLQIGHTPQRCSSSLT
jgi:hypothetical protein